MIYDYQPSRSSACEKGFLGNYVGYLLSDGYAVYDCLEHVTQAACLAHVRRKFTDAQKALNYIGKLYQIEKEAKPLSSLERQRLRLEKSKPFFGDFHQWLIKAKSTALPKIVLGKAINYSLNQWPKLLTYLENGGVSIDNNVTERDIRPFTTGRKPALTYTVWS